MDYVNFDLNAMSAAQIAELLAHHDRRYWELGEPEIPDARYDEIVEALRRLDPANPLLQRINSPQVASGGKVRHADPMLSLDKAYSLAELLEWGRKYVRSPQETILVEPKYDGISANYDGRILSTRGDGELGEDISDKLPLIELETTGYTGSLDRPVRGELVIRDDDFRTLYSHIRKKDGKTYKNSRNAVAGIMGLKEIAPMVVQKAKLTLVDYNLISIPVPFAELESRWEDLKTQLAALPYPMDGIVLKLADENYRRELGNTVHHPRGEIAYKFTNASAQSRLVGVEWSFGKNCLTPVAILEPVELSGITIKRATLHNVQNVIDMDLQIGDEVTIERAGDVIPQVVSSTPGLFRTSPLIEQCPACQTILVRRGPELCCPNEDCPEVRLFRLLDAVRKLGIERLGEPTLRKLIAARGVRKLKDLFMLKEADVATLEGFAAKSGANLIAEIQKAKSVDDFQLLAALNIAGVGPNIAKLLLQKYSIEELRTVSADALAQIDGIGPERAAAVTATLRDQSELLSELLETLEVRRFGGSSDQPTVCFTGKMPEKRSFYEELAARNGMRAVDAVTSTLSLLVAADVTGESSKLKNARKFGVKVLSLDEFMSLYGGIEEKREGELF